MGSIRNKNNWNNASKRLFAIGSYSLSRIPGFPFRLFCSQEQKSRNIFRNIFRNVFFFRNIPNERTLKDIRRRVSRSFAGQFPILFGLCWSVFDFYFSDALFSPCTVCYRDQLKYLNFFPDENEGHFPFCSLKFPTSPLFANGVARACLWYKYANYTMKVNKTEDFQMSGNSPTK